MTTLVTRVLREKRLLVLLVAAAIAVDAGLYAFAVYPWSIKVRNAAERAERADANRIIVQQNFGAAQATLEGKTQADSELRRFYRDILPRDLAGARGITALRLATLADENDLILERRSTTPDRDGDSPLARLRMTMLLEGEYRNIRQFVYALETAPEFIVIEEIALSEGEEGDAAQVLTLGLATYYWAEPDVS